MKKGEEIEYVELNNRLQELKDYFVIVFSEAHIYDLQNDLSNKKNDDLKFIEKFSGNNYINKNWSDQDTICYLATPSEVFDDLIDSSPFQNIKPLLEETFSDLNDMDGISGVGNLINAFKGIKIKTATIKDFLKFEDEKTIPDIFKEAFIPDKEDLSIGELVDFYLENFHQKFFNNPNYFKEFRRESINLSKIKNDLSADNPALEFNYNNEVYSQELDSFIDSQAKVYKEKKQFKTLYITIYNYLHITGFDKQKNSKSNLKNNYNDALHSFYGGYCDIFVTNDKATRDCSNFMYKKFFTNTVVVNSSEFLNILNSPKLKEQFYSNFAEKFLMFFQNCFAFSRDIIEKNIVCTQYEIKESFFGYFDILLHYQLLDNSQSFRLTRLNNSYSNFTMYAELEAIKNRISLIFGTPINTKKEHNFIIEAVWSFDCFAGILKQNAEKVTFDFVIGT